MKQFRSLLVLLTIVSLVVPLLAGCAQPTPAPTPTSVPKPTEAKPAEAKPTETPKPTEAPKAAAKPLEGREITVLLIADKTWAPDLVKEFEDTTGAKVNVVLADFEEMQTKFTAAAAA